MTRDGYFFSQHTVLVTTSSKSPSLSSPRAQIQRPSRSLCADGGAHFGLRLCCCGVAPRRGPAGAPPVPATGAAATVALAVAVAQPLLRGLHLAGQSHRQCRRQRPRPRHRRCRRRRHCCLAAVATSTISTSGVVAAAAAVVAISAPNRGRAGIPGGRGQARVARRHVGSP